MAETKAGSQNKWSIKKFKVFRDMGLGHQGIWTLAVIKTSEIRPFIAHQQCNAFSPFPRWLAHLFSYNMVAKGVLRVTIWSDELKELVLVGDYRRNHVAHSWVYPAGTFSSLPPSRFKHSVGVPVWSRFHIFSLTLSNTASYLAHSVHRLRISQLFLHPHQNSIISAISYTHFARSLESPKL